MINVRKPQSHNSQKYIKYSYNFYTIKSPLKHTYTKAMHETTLWVKIPRLENQSPYPYYISGFFNRSKPYITHKKYQTLNLTNSNYLLQSHGLSLTRICKFPSHHVTTRRWTGDWPPVETANVVVVIVVFDDAVSEEDPRPDPNRPESPGRRT